MTKKQTTKIKEASKLSNNKLVGKTISDFTILLKPQRKKKNGKKSRQK